MEDLSGDTLYVDYDFSDAPVGFEYADGMKYKLNTIADCSETGPPCFQGTIAKTRLQVYFSPDANCTDCGKGQLVTCKTDLETEIKCPTCEPCEGLVPVSFNIDRKNFEFPDNDNNYKPDGSGSIDPGLVAVDRFISGDTLKAVYRGRFVTSLLHPQWEAAFSVMQLPSGFGATITPLGGSAKIIKEDGTTYTADLVQQFPSGTQVITNLHPGNLNYLGNNVPADLVYENNDTVEVTVLFTVSDPTFNVYTDGNVFKPLIIDDYSFATHDTLWDVAPADRYACDDTRDRVYYVEMKAFLSSSNGTNLGGCSLGHNGYDWVGFFIGNYNLDYFPFEYRTPKGHATIHKTYIAPGLIYDRYRWHYYAKDFIGRPDPVGIVPITNGVYGDLDSPGSINQGYYWGEIPVTSPYITIVGDTLYFRSYDFIRDNFGALIADEGYRFVGYPRFIGSCESTVTTVNGLFQKPRYWFSLDPKVFGYDELETGRVAYPISLPPDNSNGLVYGYVGAPNLSIQTPIKTQQMIGEETCFEVQLVNSSDYASQLTWLTVQNASGSILIQSVRDITNPASPITYTPQVGIYQIGLMNSAVSGSPFVRVFEICVTGNNCSIDSMIVNTGWNCKTYPYSLAEATCNNPQTLYLEPVDAELGMIIKFPETPVINDLCAEQDYVIQLSSTVLGSLSDINLQFDLPDGQLYIPGSFEIAYPPPSSGNYLDATWESASDPINLYGNTWKMNVSQQDTVLESTGLPGTLMLGLNYTFVRFKTVTTCNYASGSRARFLSWAYNACGDLTNYKFSPAGAVQIAGLPEIYKTEVKLDADTLNPCLLERADINVEFAISPGSVSTASKDSILIKLPPGVHYVPGSFVNIMNAGSLPPVVQVINGQENLIWDIVDGLTALTQVKFKFSIEAQDAQQECRAYPIVAYTFSSKTALCVSSGTECAVRAISDETEEFITFVKPNVSLSEFQTSTTALLPDMEEVCYSFSIKNTGEDAPAGTPFVLEVYAEDGDGDLGTGDVLLFTRTFNIELANGDSLNLDACDTVMAGTTCRLMAVINPATSCVCEVMTSFLSYPRLIQSYTTDFEACSNELITGVGPIPLTKGVDYKWLPTGGSNIAFILNTDTTQTTFKARNTSGVNYNLDYVLRTTRNNQCADYDTIHFTVYPEIRDSAVFNVCMSASFNLAGPTGGTNYQWSPTTGLNNPNSPITTVSGLSAPRDYRLDYLDANGCPAFYIAKVSLIDCGNTALGDTVWLDYNFNGIQEANEPGLENIEVQLFYANDLGTPISSTLTDANGFYIFDTIPAADYVIKFILPNGASFTKSNLGSDTDDSDANIVTGFTTNYYVPNGVRNLDFDAGILFFDFSDAPNSYKTNLASSGAQHVIIPDLFLGDEIDAEPNGFPVAVGTAATGDDNQMTVANIDDEDALSSIPPLGIGLKGFTYTLQAKATNETGMLAYLTAWVDFDRNGTFDANEGVQVPVPDGSVDQTFDLNFTVPSDISVGMSYIRLRLTKDAGITTSTPGGLAYSGEVEDYEVLINDKFADLALTKVINTSVSPGPYAPGQSITFTITVTNQGNLDATNVQVNDYIPTGLSLNDADWTQSGSIANLNLTIPLVAAMSTASVDITFTINSDFRGTSLVNNAEIASSDNIYDFPDRDSREDAVLGNDVGGVPGTNTDNHITDDGLDTDGNGITDEDDADPASIPIIDMALRKVIATAPPYTYGQLIQFNIWVINQGTVSMQNTIVTDYIPSGYSYSAADNIGWFNAAPTVSYTIVPIINPGDSLMVPIQLRILSGTGATNWTNFAQITEIRDATNALVNNADADSNPNSSYPAENNVVPGTTNDNNIYSTAKGTEEDDHDPAWIQVYDLALKKVKTTAGPYRFGDPITYNHWIFNQGNVTARNISIVDSLPCGLTYLIGNSPTWSYNTTTREATTTYAGPLLPGDSVAIPITLQLTSCITQKAYTNISEITSSQDGAGSPALDIDSSPDGNQANDGTPIDNATTNALDQDDHDPETLEIIDLALKKELLTAGPYTYGQALTFRIKVFNQGTISVQNTTVADYIPSGFNYLASDNPLWTGSIPTVSRIITNTLNPGDSTFVDIILRVKQTTGASNAWINYSQITSVQDLSGTDRTNDDSDSQPGSNNAAELSVLPGSTADNNISSTNLGGEEDDHDPAGIQIFDLALRKTIVNPKTSWTYGDTVCFEVKVFNQGSITASDVTILDYIPCGYEFLVINEPAWIYSSSSRIAQMTLTGNIVPGDSVSYQIKLKVNYCSTANAYVNKSEIFRAEDAAGNNMTNNDIDSRPDNNPTNDAGGAAGTSSDDHIADDGRDTNADGITDEDDEDPAMIQIIDMALRKTVATAGPYSYNQLITFNIRIFNQGNVPLQNTKINDYIPSGYSYASGDNIGWTGAAPLVSYIYAPVINPGDSALVTINLRVQMASGISSWNNYAEISEIRDNTNTIVNTKEADSNPASNAIGETAVTPGSINDDNISSIAKGGEEDDHDPAGIQIFDLAMKKIKPVASSYTYGDVITYTHWVYNQGNIVARNIALIDSIPCGLEYLVVNNGTWTYNTVSREANTVLAGPLNPGDSVMVTIQLKLIPCTGTASFTNISEISSATDNGGVPQTDIDSSPDGNQNNDGTPIDNATTNLADQDDHDPEFLEIWDLALKKELVTAGPYTYGQSLTFRIKVFNQGSIAAHNIVVTDYIPTGYTFVAATNPNWTNTSPNVNRTIVGPLNPGDSTFVDIILTIATTSGGSTNWNNYSEISSFQNALGVDKTGSDIDSRGASNGAAETAVTPGSTLDDNISSTNLGAEEDDHDPAGIQIFDLAMKKIKPVASSYAYGDVITYTHWVYNQGNVVARNIALIDSIPCGLEYLVVNDGTWTYNTVSREANTVLAGPLNPGDSVMVTIQLKLIPCTGTASFTNISEISSATDKAGVPQTDIDSNPDNNQNNDGTSIDNATTDAADQDDHDPEFLEIWDLALKKELVTPSPYFYGQSLTFRIKVFNQGSMPAHNVVVTDYIPSGYTFVGATNPNWTNTSPNVNRTIAGPLNPGDSTYVDIILTLASTSGGSANWNNYSEIRSFQNALGVDKTSSDIDSKAATNGAAETAVTPGSTNDDNISSTNLGGEEDDHDPAGPEIFDLALRKQLAAVPANLRNGDQIHYLITVFNQGNTTAQNIVVTDRFPCGYNFIDDPVLNAGWTNPSAGIIEKTITTTLLPGASIVLDVYFTIDVPPIDCPSAIDVYKNIAEIKSAEDTNGDEGFDIDSDPNSNTPAENAVQPNGVGDDVVDVSDPSGNQDDHDPADLSLFDLALRKTLDTNYKSAPYRYGDVLKFDIQLVCQGNICVDEIKVVDYIPSGFVFVPGLNPDWTLVGSNAEMTYDDKRLCWRDSATVSIYLQLQQDLSANAYVNYAEITEALDTNGKVRTEDNDSYFNVNSTDDSGGVVNTSDDDNLDGMGPDRKEDEDDHDPAFVEIFDLALRKQILTAAPYRSGDLVTFLIEVHNQGNVVAEKISVVDNLPCGYTFDPALNPELTLNGTNVEATIGGPILPLEYAKIELVLKVTPCNQTGAYVNIAEITSAYDSDGDDRTKDDADSNPDSDPTNDGDPINDEIKDPKDEDDHDPELLPVHDLAIRKIVVDPTRIYLPDEIVDFKITVFNQGNQDAYNINVAEYIAAGYVYDIANDSRTNPWVLNSPSVAVTSIKGPIAPQDSVVLEFSLIIKKGFKYPADYINTAEISSFTDDDGNPLVDMDSDPDSDPTNDGDIVDDEIDNKDDDEDDSDTGLPIFQIYDLALKKTIAPNQYAKIGELLEYRIKVFNQGLNGTVSNVTIVEYIPSGLEFVASANPTWVLNGANAETIITTPIVDGDSAEVVIFLRVLPNATAATMTNYAEIKYFEDEVGDDVTDREIDSTPDDDSTNDVGGVPNTINDDRTDDDGTEDEDDHDGAVPQVFDLALVKRTAQVIPVRVGDDVTFTLTVFNQGNVVAQNIEVNEYIPSGYILSPADLNSWTSVSAAHATNIIAGPIIPGDSANIQIVLRVLTGANKDNLLNIAEIASAEDVDGNTPPDVDSDPDDDPDNDGDSIDDEKDSCCGVDEDDQDGATPPIIDLALRKTTDRIAPVRPGDVVKFKIEIFNQGNIATDNNIMVDYMSNGFLFEDKYNPGWSFSGGYATYEMSNQIQPGEKDSACIYLTVLPTATTITLINKAEVLYMEDPSGTDMTNYDIDSDPDSDSANDAGGDPFGETDDVIDGDGTGPIGAGDPDFDEDDADAAHLVMCGQISCKGNINFSLDSLCMGVLTPGALLSPVASPLFAYEITVKDQWGNAHENKFDGSDIGKCFSVTIRDTFCGGNSCWSTVCIEDKYAPRIVCDTDTVSCARFMLGGLEPEVIENCGTATVTLLDERIFALPCDPDFIKRIERDYIAVDGSGNVSEKCTWVLYIERANIYETITPKDTVFQCSANYAKDADGHPHPSVVGVPTLEGDTIWPVTDLLCNIVVDYRDEEYPEVACVKRILRTWRIREWWCNQELTYTRPQWITLKDTVGPVITKHAYDMEATTSNRSCTAKVTLPSIEAVDACHTVVRIDIIFPGGILTNQNGGVVELPIGEDTVIYRAYDNCYNMTADTIIVTVKDDTEPIAICDRKTVVALNRSGFNWVPADVFDDGSFDECHIHHFEVRRMDDNSCGTTGADDWGPEVGFCCEDVGKEIMIGFKVIDGSGNEAICMVLAEVQDKEAPIIVSCPPNITVDCRFPIDLNRLDLSFGTVATSEAARNPIVIDPKYYHLIDGQPLDGLAQDNCPPIVREVVDSSGFDQCGHGVIKRNFIITDQQGNSTQCTQLITVDNFANPFDENDITWPLDFDTTGLCDARILLPELLTNPLYKQPTFSDDVCSKIGVSYSDHYFNSSPSSANKIYRVWKVIDWCQAMSGSPTIFVDTQLIRIINTIPPTILDGCRDTSLCSYDASCSDVAIRFPIKAEDDCNGPDELLYTFSIDLHSDGTIDWTTAGVAAYMVNRSWPVGTHRVTWEVEDLNGNISRCSFTAELKNCKSPIAYCHYGIAVGLTPTDLNGNGSFDPYPVDNEIDTVWAKDIDAGSYNICGTGVKLSFSRDTADKFKVFTCDHANTRQDVELWVTDIYGNQSYCRTYILVQDNNNVPICPSNLTATVSGLITTEESQQVESVDVSMDKSKAEIVKSNFDGEYKFKTTQVGNDYEIKPEKNDDWLNGVTTADIVKIQKHILGINEITSPYKMIAADVNKSGTVTAKDISDLRKLILGVTADVSTNTSWRFADATYPFRDAESAITEAFPESYKIVPLLSDMKVDFKGIKIGDLNESAKTRGVMGISTRSAIRLKLNIEEKLISADEIQAVEFGSDNIEDYDGFQMTLTYDANALELQEIIGNHEVGMQRENFHIIRKGMITMSWDGKATNKDKLFTIIFKSNVEGSLSKYIHLSSAVTPALAIAKGEKLEDEIELIATNKSNEQIEFAVMQNEPNPWSKETHIGMFLPTSGEVQMTIYDAAGKVFLQEEKLLKGGYNEWNVDDNILPQSGVYYYQVDFAGQTITKKMVFVK